MTAYATIEDLYQHGLPRGLLSNPGRLVGTVSTDASTIALDGHGFSTDTVVSFRPETGGELPYPIAEGTAYYAIPTSDSLFQVAASAGGAAVELQTPGEHVVVSTSLLPTIEAELERYSRLIDSYLPAHAVPLTAPFPTVAVGLVAELAATSLLRMLGKASAQIDLRYEEAKREMARLARSIPLRDSRATAHTNLAVAKSAAADPRGWGSEGGYLP